MHLESNPQLFKLSQESRTKETDMSTRKLQAVFAVALFTASFLAVPFVQAVPRQDDKKQRSEQKYQEKLVKEVRHQLVMLPYYTVFDNLAYQVDGDKVTLVGQVTRPTLKSDAEAAVKSIEGVASVVNNIEVLPPSPNDDRIRRAVYRAIYGNAALSRYSLQAVPSIHIVVKSGNVFLEGVADSEADKNLANIKANGVSGVFSVKNNLVVSKS
jgi:hyperosmotically inducible protein